MLKKYKELILYLIFGVSTTVANWIIYTIAISLFNMNMTVSNTVAWAGAVIFAFITNKWIVFESKNISFCALFREVVTFFSSRIFSGLIEIFTPALLYSLGLKQSLWGIEGFLAKAIVSVIVVILNYILSKLIVFRKK